MPGQETVVFGKRPDQAGLNVGDFVIMWSSSGGVNAMSSDQSRKTLRLRSAKYQPSKAELEEDMRINATPEELARAILQPVKVEHIPDDD